MKARLASTFTRALLVMAAPGVLAACGGSTQADVTDAGQGIADAALADAMVDAPQADAPLACPSNLAGPRLLAVHAPTGHDYCIGATEVTNAQYAAFLAANPNGPTAQSALCVWLQTWQPYALCSQTYDPVGRPDYPVACVSWCAAQAYCNWAGQRLCGRIGPAPYAMTDLADANRDEWFSACSAGGTHAYPYGDSYNGTACNGQDFGGADGGALPYEQLGGCSGGVAGLMEMSGNVYDWEDACEGTTGPTDLCAVRGGFFGSTSDGLRCDAHEHAGRNVSVPAIGIRCCY